jgi:hypothetical protein
VLELWEWNLQEINRKVDQDGGTLSTSNYTVTAIVFISLQFERVISCKCRFRYGATNIRAVTGLCVRFVLRRPRYIDDIASSGGMANE